MNRLIVAKNIFNKQEWEEYHTDDIIAKIIELFERWPKTARIYHDKISKYNDVTPKTKKDVADLENKKGTFFIVIYPADPTTAIIAGIVVAIAALTAVSFLLAPKIPQLSQRNRRAASPNNELSQRTNRARPNSRIPDIFGQVLSVPDLIMVPYRKFENNQELEIAYMCVGKGSYSTTKVKDGDTLVSEISGASVEIYGPNTSPNSGDSPQTLIGDAITEDVYKVFSIGSVNGQTLRSPNEAYIIAVAPYAQFRFEYPNTIRLNSSIYNCANTFEAGDVITIEGASFSASPLTFSVKFTLAGEIVFETDDPTDYFYSGLSITLSDAARTDGSNPVNLAGTYDVTSVDSTTVTLDNPSSVNADWDVLDDWSGDETGYDNSDLVPAISVNLNSSGYDVTSVNSDEIVLSSPSSINTGWNWIDSLAGDVTTYMDSNVIAEANKWIGPFFIDQDDITIILGNFVALNGLYKDDGNNQIRFDVVVELEITPVDEDDTPTGSPETFQGTIIGSATRTDTRAITIEANPTFTGRCSVRARRVTDTDKDFDGAVVDEIKWHSLYGLSEITETNFGNVTTVYSKTYATTGALSIKERQLNMLATRKIPTRISGSTFTSSLTATLSADEIISFICLDQYIGNRNSSEIDFDSVYDTVSEIKSYFGDNEAGEFSYTFDNDNISFEETIASIAESCFCTAYRQANQIKISFEKETENSTLIFNHRNKIPGTEIRSIKFGNDADDDGVELEYIDPSDDLLDTYFIPTDRTAINPRAVETIGIRSTKKAFWHAWRVWNKIQYQNVLTEFETTQEAATTVIKDRILVADNTRPSTQDGEVIGQSSLTLTLSQSVTFEAGKSYVIYLQNPDGSVESTGITAGSSSKEIVLDSAVSFTLVTDQTSYARTTYIIIPTDDKRTENFLIIDKVAKDFYSYKLSAVNYSSLYYQQDQLQLWFPFFEANYNDESPFGNNGTAQGGATTTTDAERGIVHIGASTSDFVTLSGFTAPAAYTKTAWINKDSLSSANDGHILSSSSAMNEAFYVDDTGNLTGGHNGSDYVSYALPSATTWHHVAVSYNPTTTTMTLYLNGEQVDQNTGVAQRTLANLTLFAFNSGDAFIGKVDNIRLYKTDLSPSSIKNIYKTS